MIKNRSYTYWNTKLNYIKRTHKVDLRAEGWHLILEEKMPHYAIAGYTYPKGRLIVVLMAHQDDIPDTIDHELAHAVNFTKHGGVGHDSLWVKYYEDIKFMQGGIKLLSYITPEHHTKRRGTYVCKGLPENDYTKTGLILSASIIAILSLIAYLLTK